MYVPHSEVPAVPVNAVGYTEVRVTVPHGVAPTVTVAVLIPSGSTTFSVPVKVYPAGQSASDTTPYVAVVVPPLVVGLGDQLRVGVMGLARATGVA